MVRRYVPAQPEHPQPDHTRPDRNRRQRAQDAVLAALAARLTARDRWLIHLLWDHHVLTTPQIAQLAYPSQDRARHGMLRLARLGVVDSIRVLLPPGHGSAPLHHVLGPAGARVLAAEQGIPFAELGYHRDRVQAWTHSPVLDHLIGVNGVFTALHAAARQLGDARLARWWSEQRCATTWRGCIRPDGYGRWCQDGARLDFFLEYDTGSETLTKVARKLRGYAELAADGVTTPVLIWTPSATREANLHRHLAGAPVPVATASTHAIRDPAQGPAEGPAGPIWRPVDHPPTAPRQRLITLARYVRSDRASSGTARAHQPDRSIPREIPVINSRRGLDDGSITLFVVVFFIALLAAAGLIVDGGAKLRAARQATAVAEEAARAGAGRVDTDRAYAQGGRFTISPSTALTAARTHMAASGGTGSARIVNGQQIRVTVTISRPTVLLAAIGIGEVSATKTATANLVQGVEQADR